jgi:hypothetical protein
VPRVVRLPTPTSPLLVLVAALVLTLPATALGGSRERIYRDCQDGRIDGHYSQKQYRDALSNIPTDVDEYTDCRDVIRRAQLGGGGSSGGSTGGGANTTGNATAPAAPATRDPLATASPNERAAVERTRDAGSKPVQVAGELIKPGALGYDSLSSASKIPTPLLVVLLLLAAAAAIAGVLWLRSRVITRRPT